MLRERLMQVLSFRDCLMRCVMCLESIKEEFCEGEVRVYRHPVSVSQLMSCPAFNMKGNESFWR